MQETQGSQVGFLGQEESPEDGMATHFNIPAWRILWTEEPRRLQSIGLQRVGHDWSDLARTDLQPESKNQTDGLQSPDWLAGQAVWSHVSRCFKTYPLRGVLWGRWTYPSCVSSFPWPQFPSPQLNQDARGFTRTLWHWNSIQRWAHRKHLLPLLPSVFCWQFPQCLKYLSLSYPVLWPELWSLFPGSEVTECWARGMSNCCSLQLNFVSYRCPEQGSPGSSAQSRIRPLHLMCYEATEQAQPIVAINPGCL